VPIDSVQALLFETRPTSEVVPYPILTVKARAVDAVNTGYNQQKQGLHDIGYRMDRAFLGQSVVKENA